MSVRDILGHATAKNATLFEEALREELRSRVAAVIEAKAPKMSEDEDEDDQDGMDDEDDAPTSKPM